jgi:hypothetical protein
MNEIANHSKEHSDKIYCDTKFKKSQKKWLAKKKGQDDTISI